nr:15407_t:CDS:2 [Entrophospora candida]
MNYVAEEFLARLEDMYNLLFRKQEASQEPEEDLPLPTTPIDIIFDPLKAKLGNNDLDSYAIPQDFLRLINREITNKEVEINEDSDLNKKLRIAFGKWIGFKEPIGPREVDHHKEGQSDYQSTKGFQFTGWVEETSLCCES